jgi:putative ABC transport system permease protein
MDYKELFSESVGTLLLNKMRTGLAMLGIVIGIGSVIALLSIGEASQQSITTQIQSLGANILTVSPGAQRTGLVRGAQGGGTTLTYEDAKALSSDKTLTALKTVLPTYAARSQVVYGDSNTNTSITGITPEYLSARNIKVTAGGNMTENDLNGNTNVAIIGPTVLTALWGDDATSSEAIGQIIRIGALNFNVIGVTEVKGGSGMSNQDDIIYIPLSTAQKKLFGVKYLSSIIVETTSEEVMTQAMNQIGYTLLERHHIKDTTKADFTIRNQQDMLNAVSSVTGTLTSLLSGVAAISLLVGGIGIMNIMLVTVTERTREIGLRKALGAKDKLIITQFLMEAVILTFVGGLIGILLGILLAYIYATSTSGLFVVSISSVFLAFAVSTIIGVVFGWYPARKAASLQPIEALRYE